jgi:hypothetical protein
MMSSTSQQTYDDAGGNNSNRASSSSPRQQQYQQQQQQQQQHQQQQQQQHHQQQPQQHQQQQIYFGSNQSPSDSATQHQQLFPKPHPAMLPIISTNTNIIVTNPGIISSGTIDTPPEPLHTTVPHLQQHQHQHQQPSTSIAAATAAASPNTIALNNTVDHNNPHFTRGEGVKEPLPTDVICGRGKMTSSHPANRRFRELVDSQKASYQNSKRRDEKTRITCELVDKLRGEGR